jgi:protein O-mannosyl-transferase
MERFWMRNVRPRKRAHRTASDSKSGFLHTLSPDSLSNPSLNTRHSAAWSPFSGRARWVSLALIAANLIVYASVWHHDFVNYDDDQYVTSNPVVLRGLTWHGVSWAFTTGYAVNWHPLTWLSHMLDVQLYGLDPGPHHLTNLLFHIANTLLLLGLLHRMTGALGRSAFVAALFAVHPLHVESVAWVAERKDVLSTLFWILTLWAYVEYVRRPNLYRYGAVLLFFALGLMAKPMLVTLPFVLLLLDFWPLGRMRMRLNPAGGWAFSGGGWDAVMDLVWEKLPLLALAVAASIVTLIVHRQGGAVISLSATPLKLRVANALVSYVVYIGKMLWPVHLAVLYPYAQSIPGWWVAGALLTLVGISVAVIWAGARHPYLPIGWLWYLGTLVPVIGLIQVGDQAMADRYTYVPLIGLFIVVAWGIPDLLAHWPLQRIALPVAAGLVILACAIAARSQLQYWKDSTTLWTRALAVTTGNNIAHNNLAIVLADQGKLDEAIAHYSEALRIKPDYATARNNLGLALADEGKLDEAIAHYSEALRIKPDYADALNNWGAALAAEGKLDEAIAHYSEALRIKPDYAGAHNNWGIALASEGKSEEAIAHFSEALRIKPDYADAHNNWAGVLASEGKLDEAIAHCNEALRIKPDYADAHNNLGVALADQGKLDEAIAHFSEALRINPDDSKARDNLRLTLAERANRPDSGARRDR